jgi:hypothetical protein
MLAIRYASDRFGEICLHVVTALETVLLPPGEVAMRTGEPQ